MNRNFPFRGNLFLGPFLVCAVLCSAAASNPGGPSIVAERHAAMTATPNCVTEACRELELGKLFEHEERLEDAERAYSKAVEKASLAELNQAKDRLRDVVAKRDSLWVKRILPLWDGIVTALWAVAPLVFLVLLLWWPLKFAGRRWGNKRVAINSFTDASSGAAFGYVLRTAIADVQDYYRLRDQLRFVTFVRIEVVDASQAPEWSDLATDLVPGDAGKLISRITGKFFKARYSFSGLVQKIGTDWALVVKFSEDKSDFHVWNGVYAGPNFVQYQQSIAYKAAKFLKDHVGTARNR